MKALIGAAGLFVGCLGPGLGDDIDKGPPDGRIDDGPVVVSNVPPPAISGGTLLVSRDGHTAYVSDPDRDLVWIVDLVRSEVVAASGLQPGDEPGRIAEDLEGRIHVALRRGGVVASFDPAYAQRIERRSVCAEPRGIAYDAAGDVLHVACAGGELVTLPAAGGEPTRRLRLDRDLRDVVVRGDRLIVSRFRSAEVLTLDPNGAVEERSALSGGSAEGFEEMQTFEPDVAWRMVGLPDGGVFVSHQLAQAGTVSIQTGGYGGEMGTGIVQTATSIVDVNGVASAPTIQTAGLVLPVDAAVSADGAETAVAGAGSDMVLWNRAGSSFFQFVEGQPTAVAFAGDDLVVQTRDPAAVHVLQGGAYGVLADTIIELPGESRTDSGHMTFHRSSEFTSLACASCHPEGREDGRTWDFQGIGPRRTQNLSGGILGTEPFHWDGELPTFTHLVDEVMVKRMGAMRPSNDRITATANWVDTLPAPAASEPEDTDAVARGRALFEGAGTQCSACHAGDKRTNGRTVDVGTGGSFQVPSLVGVSARAPLLHDGCAETLTDRFGTCGGGDRHGTTSHLDAAEIADLVAYLETL